MNPVVDPVPGSKKIVSLEKHFLQTDCSMNSVAFSGLPAELESELYHH